MDANLLGSLLLLGIVFLGLGVIIGVVKLGSVFKWIVLAAVVVSVANRIGWPLLRQFHHQHGNLAFFLVICAVIVILMFSFPFTRAVLASTIGAFIYDHIRLLLLFTGVGAILTGLVYSLSRWIMQ